MILVDTSVWIDHLRATDIALVRLLEQANVACHPFIIGELALGSMRNRSQVIENMSLLPALSVAADDFVLGLIERFDLHGQGIGYVDAHLLSACLMHGDCRLWTRDRRLQSAAQRCNIQSVEGFSTLAPPAPS